MTNISEQEIVSAKQAHEDWLMSLPNVIGCSVGLDGSGTTCIRVLATQLEKSTVSAIHERLKGIPVVIDEGPEIVAGG